MYRSEPYSNRLPGRAAAFAALATLLTIVASHPVAGNAASDPTSLPAFDAVAKHLVESG